MGDRRFAIYVHKQFPTEFDNEIKHMIPTTYKRDNIYGPYTLNALSREVEQHDLGIELEHFLSKRGMHTVSDLMQRLINTTCCFRLCPNLLLNAHLACRDLRGVDSTRSVCTEHNNAHAR